jgi:hypothetical protein
VLGLEGFVFSQITEDSLMLLTSVHFALISGFRRDVDEFCALLTLDP